MPQEPAVYSLSAAIVGRAVDSMAPEFVRWHDPLGPADAARRDLALVKDFLKTFAELAETSSATDLPSSLLRTALESDPHSADPERMEALGGALALYVNFLGQTGRWTGADADFDRVLDLLDSNDSPDPLLSDLRLPDLTVEQEAAELAALPVVRRGLGLLAWIGGGREATASGQLRRRDIEEAAACIGVRARGAGPGRGRKEPIRSSGGGGRGAGDPGDGPRVVRSMAEVPQLVTVLTALHTVGATRLVTSHIVPGPAAETLLAGPDGAGTAWLGAARDFVTEFLACDLDRIEDGRDGSEVAELALTLLAAGSSDHPAPLEWLLAAPDRAGAAERPAARRAARAGHRLVREWEEWGLLTVGTALSVPDVVRASVAEVLADGLGGMWAACDEPRPEDRFLERRLAALLEET
ncbi:hypothetical protein NCCP1664_28930 [Zafaria cholistanensis]|uniref:Uncharacterized protein n=1 Tax=Zafaria cholistanensis TaxID=1682741 RepID=A0A5A7NVX1_9MICC|nr:hypothetical protein [Zafaria cholistanensis]GER24398.1 hypothetical protein NCCP1664_28930 [Zafaria cholistanensis]